MLLVQGVFFFFHINKMTEEKKDEENNVPRVSSPFLKVEGRGRRRLKRRRDLHRGSADDEKILNRRVEFLSLRSSLSRARPRARERSASHLLHLPNIARQYVVSQSDRAHFVVDVIEKNVRRRGGLVLVLHPIKRLWPLLCVREQREGKENEQHHRCPLHRVVGVIVVFILRSLHLRVRLSLL